MKNKNFALLAFFILTSATLASCLNVDVYKKGATYLNAIEIVRVAKKNDHSIAVEKLLSSLGYKGDENFTNEKMILLLHKAFPSLERPSPYYISFAQNRGLNEYSLANWDELSENLQSSLDYFQSRSLYFPKTKHVNSEHPYYYFNPHDKPSKHDLATILRRIQGYIGKSPEDDFYSFVNHQELFSKDQSYRSNFVDKKIIDANLDSFLKQITGENKTRIDNFMETYFNEGEKKSNLAGLKGLFAKIQEKSKRDIYELLKEEFKRSSESILLPYLLTTKMKDSRAMGNCMVLHNENLPFLSDFNNPVKFLAPAYRSFESLRSLVGGDSKERLKSYESFMEKYFIQLKRILAINPMVKETSNGPLNGLPKVRLRPSEDENAIVMSDLYGGKESGKNYDTNRILVARFPSIVALFLAISEASEDELRAYLIHSYIQQYNFCLPKEIRMPILAMQGKEMINDKEEFMPYIANEILDSYQKTTSYTKNVKTVETLFGELKSTLQKRFDANTWIDGEGKKKLKEKLNNMTAVIMTKNVKTGEKLLLPTHEYKSTKNNDGSLYSNYCIYNKARMELLSGELGKMDGKATIYTSDVFMANAFNDVSSNTIFIPPGYFFSKKESHEESKEELLCDFGFVIGHEMTHSFDNNGAIFNEKNELVSEWLGEKNMLEFKRRNDKVSKFYSGFEEVPGYKEKGELKVMEATADLGGFNMILDIAKTYQEFDYRKLFILLAKLNFSYVTSDFYVTRIMNDSHPLGGGRINPLLMHSDEFKEAFKVKEKDFMYLAKEKYVNVW